MSASSFRFAHVADLHIGAGYAHGDEDAGGVNSRLVDFREAWVRSCRQMVEERVGVVVFAGDAFRDAKPSPTEIAAFQAGLDILAAAGIEVTMILGNHDTPRATGRTNALQMFERGLVGVITRPCVLDGTVPIACFPWPNRAHIAAADPEFAKMSLDDQNRKMVDLSLNVIRALWAEADALGGPFGCILVGHGSIAGSTIGADGSTAFLREAVLPLPELKDLPFRYQAWGHLHKAQSLGCRIRYSGSIERCDFSEAQEDKGWWLVELGDDPQEDSIEWRSSSPRPFIDIELQEIEMYKDYGQLAINVADTVKGAVVRVKYTATPEVARTVDHNAIRRALYAAGAVKVHGPIANIVHTVTEESEAVTEDTDMMTGWNEWANLQGLSGPQRERLDDKVQECLEVAP